jgi:serine/threonine-protein kinase
MSPEQASGLRTTPASDVFSLGLILFEMLTGRRAFSEESPVETMLKVRTADVASELADQVDEDHRALLTALLARDESKRPGAAHVAESLAANAKARSQ